MRDADRPVALITGASRGIGRAIALELGRDHHIVAGARSASALGSLLGELDSAEPFVVDVRDESRLEAAIAALGRIDVLVHSAGVAIEKPFVELTARDWRDSFDVNLFGVVDLTRLALPALRAARGTVVFLNSGSGLFSYQGGAAYSGTKFALRTLADCLREEERGNGVRVSSVHPGFVDTAMGRGVREHGEHALDSKYYLAPETIAAAVRLAIDAPPEAQIEMMSIRPSFIPAPALANGGSK